MKAKSFFTDTSVIEVLFWQARLHFIKSLKQNIGKNMFYQVKQSYMTLNKNKQVSFLTRCLFLDKLPVKKGETRKFPKSHLSVFSRNS